MGLAPTKKSKTKDMIHGIYLLIVSMRLPLAPTCPDDKSNADRKFLFDVNFTRQIFPIHMVWDLACWTRNRCVFGNGTPFLH